MKDDLSSIFHKPEFKQLLAKYSDMIENHTSIYLEPDEITLLAEFYASMGNIKACEEVVDYGVMLHPDNPDILIFKCHNLIIKGHTHEAQKLLNSIADPNDYEVRLLQAELYLAQKRNQEADELLNQLYQDEKNTDTMLDIAHLYMDGHQKKNAYYWLQKASNEDPDNLGLLEELASYHFSFGNVEEAVDLYNRLLDEAPYTIDFWHNLIRCYLRMYKPEKAMEAIDFAMAIDDTNLITWELKSNALLLENEIDKAMECLFYIENILQKSHISRILSCRFISLCKTIRKFWSMPTKSQQATIWPILKWLLYIIKKDTHACSWEIFRHVKKTSNKDWHTTITTAIFTC